MATKKLEKKEALGTKINISSIVKKAKQKREAATSSEPNKTDKTRKSEIVVMTITVSKSLWNEYRELYYELKRELGSDYVYLSRGDVFVKLIEFMDSSLNIDISNYKDFYDNYIGAKGKRSKNDRTIPKGEEIEKNHRWGDFTLEQMGTFKRLLTKLAIKVGVERSTDFSKQYFMTDIVAFLKDNVCALSEYIKNAKKEQE